MEKKLRLGELLIQLTLILFAVVSILVTAGIVLSLGQESLRFFTSGQISVWKFFTGTKWQPHIQQFGIWPLLTATLVTSTIAMLVALRERGLPMPASAVVLSPWTDLTASGESWQANAEADYVIHGTKLRVAAGLYLGNTDAHAPLASPLYADLHGLPRLLIQVGSDEVLLSDSTHLAERAHRAGVDVTLEVWDDMQHVWHFAANILPEARQAIERVGDFVRGRESASHQAKK